MQADYNDPIDKSNYFSRKRAYKRNLKYFKKRKKVIQSEYDKSQKHDNKYQLRIDKMEKKMDSFKQLKKSSVCIILTVVCIFMGIAGFVWAYADYQEEIVQLDFEYQEKVAQLEFDYVQKEKSGELNKIWDEVFAENGRADALIINKDNLQEVADNISELNRYPEETLQRIVSQEGIEYYLYTEKYDMKKYYVSDSGTDVIYPGAIIRGDSLFHNNAYTLISANREPIFLTANHEDGFTLEVEHPAYGTVSNALRNFQNTLSTQNAKEWTYEIKTITSNEELNATLGVSAGVAQTGNSIGVNVGMSSSNESSTVVITFAQIYYSVMAEPKNNAANYFEDGTVLNCLGDYEPAYVSSVDYGRMVSVIVTADMSQEELNAKLNASFQGVGINAGLEKLKKEKKIGVSYSFYGGSTETISEAVEQDKKDAGIIGSIHAWLFGKDKEEAINKINEFIDSNNELINPVPISYELKYLSDNAIVPAMSIKRQDVFRAENARTVTIELTKEPKSGFSIYYPVGTLKMDETTFLWDCTVPVSLEGIYDGKSFAVSLEENMDGKVSSPINSKVALNLYISDVNVR